MSECTTIATNITYLICKKCGRYLERCDGCDVDFHNDMELVCVGHYKENYGDEHFCISCDENKVPGD